ncbi:DNA glycosylase [Croceivirga radicis]|uniref:DNA glycosylase n=1 Tax=Croceivirga radicis TaxID=1929488 RepID=A0A1V6LND4_9FLAO|nr:uracil-DNA glycosylase family protein [Croceivirga radicis]OQD41648.1 DNA glycosylase [Croceivirga radicis]
MFLHTHPYPPYLYPGVEKLIVGTLPPPRFTIKQLKEGDVDFCYGSRDGQLWPILDRIFNLELLYETTEAAIAQRKLFLKSRNIGICDIVDSAEREKIDASDLGMQHVKLRNIFGYLEQYPTIHTLLFTGGNSKNGPEYFFRKLARAHSVIYTAVETSVPRIHQFAHPKTKKIISTISLTAPSGAANRAVGSLMEYKRLKSKNPNFNTLDFRVKQYKPFF